MITRVLNDELEGLEREKFVAYLRDYPSICIQIREKPQPLRLWLASETRQPGIFRTERLLTT
jgi:hypothetical protein